MITTKERLCKAALELFNKNGYKNVSLREIAQAAGTTIGNLTYYFPQKDTLLAALQEEVQRQFSINIPPTNNPEEILTQLIHSFFTAQKNESEYSYYYENICEFYKDSDQVRENVISFRKELFNNYYSIFRSLRDLGVMNTKYSSEDYISLTYILIYMTTFWVSSASPYHDKDLPQIPITKSLFHLLTPYITDGYQQIFADIYRSYSENQAP